MTVTWSCATCGQEFAAEPLFLLFDYGHYWHDACVMVRDVNGWLRVDASGPGMLIPSTIIEGPGR